jgi:hypothetical protein
MVVVTRFVLVFRVSCPSCFCPFLPGRRTVRRVGGSELGFIPACGALQLLAVTKDYKEVFDNGFYNVNISKI